MSLAVALGQVAPYYNLGFVLILFTLYSGLLRTQVKNKNVFLTPWKLIFAALVVFVLEELFTILRSLSIFNLSEHVNGFFEFVIIVLFIYALLLQKEWIKKKRM